MTDIIMNIVKNVYYKKKLQKCIIKKIYKEVLFGQ